MADAKIVLSAVDQTKAAIDSAKRNLSGLGDMAGSLPSRFGTLGTAIATAFTAASLKGVIDTLDRLDDLSEKSGVAVDSLSSLRYAGEVTGTPIESLAVGMRKLSMGMAEAAGGNKEAAATFSTLGISVRDSSGRLRTQDEVLLDLADAFSGFQDGAGKSALAQKVFGKSGEELIPILNQGARGIQTLREEAQALGLVYGGDLARQAAAFNDNLKRMELAAEAAKVQLAQTLLPSLVNLTNELIEGRKAFGGYLAAMIELGVKTNPFDSWSDNAKKASSEVARLSAEVARLESGQRGLSENGGGAAFVGPSGSARAASRLEAARQELFSAQQRQAYFDRLISKNVEGEAARLEDAFNGGKNGAPVIPGARSVDGAAVNLINSLTTEYANLSGSMSKVDEVTRKMAASSEKFDPIQRQQILSIAGQIDAFKRKHQVLDAENKALAAWGDAQEASDSAYAEKLARLREGSQALAFEASLIGKTADEMERLRGERTLGLQVAQAEAQVLDQVNQGLLDEAEARRRLQAIQRYANESRQATDAIAAARRDPSQGVSAAINDYMEQAARAGDAARDATKRTLSAMEDALTDFAMTGKLSVKSMVDDMIREFIRLRVIKDIMPPLFGTGGVGTSLLSSIFGGFRAGGGPVSSSKAYIVGERGPELFFPGSSGFIAPNSVLPSSAAPVVNLHYNFNGPADATQVLTAAQLGAAMARSQIRDDMARGRT